MGLIKYFVEITGHEPPFQWQVKRKGGSGSAVTTVSLVGVKGSSSTYEEAMFSAAEAARDAEYKRAHAAAKRDEFLFEIEESDYEILDLDDAANAVKPSSFGK